MSITGGLRRAIGCFSGLALVVTATSGWAQQTAPGKVNPKTTTAPNGSATAKSSGSDASTANVKSSGSPSGSGSARPAGTAAGTAKGARPQSGPGGVAANDAPRAPAWAKLPPEHEKYLDEVLRYWQDSSGRIKRYRCNFQSWEYDGTFIKKDSQTGRFPPKSTSSGIIRYAAPDKGMFKVDKILVYTPPAKEGERAQYLPPKSEMREHWVCDGKSIFEFDHQKKQLKQIMLPPELQGKSIADGPLPFMFGAEVDKIKQRFWLRIITPQDSQGEYWIEAVPKTRQDAASFKMIHVIIDEKDFLPKSMSIFNLSHDPERDNPNCTTFVFDKRETNWNETLENLNPIHKDFWEPSTPLGYKKVVEQPGAAGLSDATTVPPAGPRQAQRPDKKK